MRRRRGGGAAPAEACGVWLDTAELKRGPARPLSARSRQSPARPAPRQSSILGFLRARTDGADKENRSPAPCSPAEPPRILPLPRLQGALPEPPGAGHTPREPLELRLQPQSGAGGPWGDRNKPWGSPGETAPGGSTAQPCSRAPAAAGDTSPAAPSAVCCSAQSPGPAQPLRERGQVLAGPCRQLFCQDCQGSWATAHRDRDRATLSPPRTLPSPPRTLPSPRPPPELGSEPLFTQDSEGLRVIKHW